MFIEQPSIWLRWLYPRATWRMDKHEKAVYLTFDDGPIPEATPFILSTLKKYGVKATFFMVGENAFRYPQLLEAVRHDGHRIGNHSYNHWGGMRHTTVSYIRNAQKANGILKTDLYRPPHGWMRWSQYALLGKDYRIVMWDLVTRDYSTRLNAQDVLSNVKRYTRNGSIITFHDSLKSIDKLKTALPEAIEWLLEQGYQFKVFQGEANS